MPRTVKADDDYRNTLVKLIPSEIVGAYLVFDGIIPPQQELGRLIVTAMLLVFTFLYLRFLNKVKKILQLAVTMVAFLVWVYSIKGSIFDLWELYIPYVASSLLVGWTLLIPVVFLKPEQQPPTKNQN